MPKIVDVMQDLGLEKEDFAKLYEQVVGKKLTAKTAIISDVNLEKLRSLAPKSSKKTEKFEEKDAHDAKVLKSDEIGFGGGFLSGLGFAKEQPKKVEEKSKTSEADLASHNIQLSNFFVEKAEERISIKQSSERYEARKISSAPEPRTHKEPYKKQSGGNISIGQ